MIGVNFNNNARTTLSAGAGFMKHQIANLHHAYIIAELWLRVNLLFEILFLILYVLAITTEFESVALAGPAVFLKRNGVDPPL